MRQRLAVTFVVMAGGRGERLWPLVRSHRPKVCLAPDGRNSLLSATIKRLQGAWKNPSWLIVTTKEQTRAVRRSLPLPLRRCVITEPQIKNTAACITLAAATLGIRDPNRVLVIVPADHWIGDTQAYRQSIRTAIRAAVSQDALVTVGVKPTHAHTGLGYLCAGKKLSGRSRPLVYALDRFVEKPSQAVARRLLKKPGIYWNIGSFVGTADKFVECISEWLPDHVERLIPLAKRTRSASFAQQARSVYPHLESVSFDHGVMDYLKGGLVVEGLFPWADLGSWDSWARVCQMTPPTVNILSQDVTVLTESDHLFATIGVEDLLVVHTPNATLICDPKRAQEVRRVVRKLQRNPRLVQYL